MRVAVFFVATIFFACASPSPGVEEATVEEEAAEDSPPQSETTARGTESTRPPTAQTVSTPAMLSDPPPDEGNMQYDFEDEQNEGALQLDE